MYKIAKESHVDQTGPISSTQPATAKSQRLRSGGIKRRIAQLVAILSIIFTLAVLNTGTASATTEVDCIDAFSRPEVVYLGTGFMGSEERCFAPSPANTPLSAVGVTVTSILPGSSPGYLEFGPFNERIVWDANEGPIFFNVPIEILAVYVGVGPGAV